MPKAQNNLIENQLRFHRVASASSKFDSKIKSIFQQHQLSFPPNNLYLRIFKEEQIVEIWAGDNVQYQHIKDYPFTAFSGTLGPKEKEGDKQIPEGFYKIELFNPKSNFHLSFKINYPNHADSIRNQSVQNLGGDIYIHGSNKSIGCIPLGDENIAELYWICLNAYSIKQQIPVHIFPCKMEKDKMEKLYQQQPQFKSFWNSLEPKYRFFQSHKMLGEVTGCDSLGNYQLAIPWD